MRTEDKIIIEQIAARDERALETLAALYGEICRRTARNILGSDADAEEALNDALYRAWNAIPASPPVHLQAYLITLTRRIALDMRKSQTRSKRGGGTVPAALSELEACISADSDVEQAVDRTLLRDAIDRFLMQLSTEKRRIFIERYTLFLRTAEIAERHGMTDSAVNMALSRIRKALHTFLEEEGFL